MNNNNNPEEAEAAMLSFGLEAVGFCEQQNARTNKQTRVERFSSSYGAWPKTCVDLVETLSASIGFGPVKLHYFFVAMYWLKNYSSEPVLAAIFKVTENTVRKFIWKYSKGIQALKPIKMGMDLDIPVPNIFLFSVDCTHCQIQEPRTLPDKAWFSHKLNRPGLSYEIALHLYKIKVAWINGPFRAGDSDLTIFRKENGFKGKIPPEKLVIADNGYGGEPQISIPNQFDSSEVRQGV